jgi:hypothetical protein
VNSRAVNLAREVRNLNGLFLVFFSLGMFTWGASPVAREKRMRSTANTLFEVVEEWIRLSFPWVLGVILGWSALVVVCSQGGSEVVGR